jgi:hypothetical protein
MAVACALIAGCGGGEAADRLSAVQVAREFQAGTGDRLRTHSASGFDQLDLAPGFGRPIPPALLREYGEFWIVVFRPGSKQSVETQLRGTKPDDRGIHWLFVRPRWLAVTVYGENVLLNWVAGRQRRVDGRWQRLDRLLERL